MNAGPYNSLSTTSLFHCNAKLNFLADTIQVVGDTFFREEGCEVNLPFSKVKNGSKPKNSLLWSFLDN